MAPAPFDPAARIEWSPVWSLRDGRFKHVPTSLLYFFYSGPAAFHADSNGCAAGNTLEEAIVQGFLELVERDAYAIWWYNRLRRPAVDLSHFNDSYVRDLQSQLAETGRKLWVLDVTSDLGVPTYVAILHWMQNGQENIEFGSGAHFDPRIAMLRTLTELNQFLSIGLMGGGTGEKSEPRRHHSVAPCGLSLPDAERHGATEHRLERGSSRQYAPSRSTPASTSPSKPASIFWSSIRRGQTSGSRSSGCSFPACAIFIAASGRAGSMMFRSSSDGWSGQRRKANSRRSFHTPEGQASCALPKKSRDGLRRQPFPHG